MKYIIVILLVLVGFGANAQIRYPTGFPTQFNTGWNRWGYAMSDSGTIIANRDTTWLPKFSGTVVFRPTNKQFYYFDSTVLRWYPFGINIDTTSLSNRINLKLNITDTTGKWLAQSSRLVDTVYRVNDSTVGYTIKGVPYTFQILGRSSGGGGGSGTVTSVSLSMPSAFAVSGSPITTSGTFNVSGAGTTAQYIRGNGTLATTDTGMIPTFYLKVRGLLTGTSPITFNQTTGAIGINNANTTGTKGAASFTSAFSDNGSGLIDLANIVSTGSCTNCSVTYNAKGQATAYSSGIAPSGSSVDTIFRTPGVDSIYYTINGVQYAIKDSAGTTVTASNGLQKVGNDIRLGAASGPGAPLIYDSYIDAGSFQLNISGANGSNAVLSSSNSSGGYGLEGASSSASGAGIHAVNTSGGIGLSAEVLAGKALYLTAISGIPLYAVGQPSNANGNSVMAEFHRQTSGTATSGIAQSFDYWSQLSNGTNDTIARVAITTTTATAGSQSGAYDIWLKNNGGSLSRVSRITSSGQQVWEKYPGLTAQTDTTTYKPVAIDGSGNVVKMTGWTGGGAIDSNSAILTSQEGILYSKSSWANTSDFVNRGATASVVGTSIQFSSGANTFTQTLDLDTTVRERWVMHIEQRVGAVSSTSDGLGIGIRSVNPNYGPSIAGILVTNNTGNGGKLLLLDVTSGGAVIASSLNSISFSAGDTIVFELERDLFTFTMRGYNRTTGSITITTSYVYSVAPSPANVLPNTGTFSIFSVGGTQLMTNLSILSKETKHAPLMCIGDSKTVGYYSSNIGRYSSLAAYYFDNTITHAGAADRLNELLTTVDEVISIKPINATISIGSNDIGYGATVSQVFTNYKKYVSILQGAGVAVYHLLPFYQTTIVAELDSLADSIRAFYPATTIIDCRTPMKECPSCFLSGDNVHPNAAGDSLIVATIINSGLLRNYYKSPSLTSKPTLDIVLFNGNTSSREIKSGNIRINRTTAIADESLTINGGQYIKKDQNANTYFVIENLTSGNSAAASTTLYNDASAYLQEAIFSSTTTPAGDIISGSTYTRSTSTAGHCIVASAGPIKFLFGVSNTEKARFNASGELQLGSTTDQGAYSLQNTGGLYQNGIINLKGLTSPPSTYNVLVHGLTDSMVYQIPASSLPGATTIYNGDGTLAGARLLSTGGNTLTVSGANNSDTVMVINNTGTTGLGLHVSGTALGINVVSSAGTGLQVFGSTRGAIITGDTDEGLLVKSNVVRGARIQTVPSSTNTVVEVLQLERGSSGGPGATGIGEYISFLNKTSTNSSDVSNTIVSKFTDGTTATRTSQFAITGVNNASAVTLMTLDGNGNATFGTTNSIVGAATNNSAVAGNIGEEINSTVSTYTNYTTTATYQNVTSITLTAGDWDITAQGTLSSNGATITAANDAIFVISTTTASASGATEGKNISYIPQAALLGTSHESTSIVPFRVSLSGTTTYYLNTQASFTVGNPQFTGTIRARRAR